MDPVIGIDLGTTNSGAAVMMHDEPRTIANADGRRTMPSVVSLGRMAVISNSVSRRAFAVRSLGNLGKKAAYRYIRRALSDPAELVIPEAVHAVGKLRILQPDGEPAAASHAGGRAAMSAVLMVVETLRHPQCFHSVFLYGLRDAGSGVRRCCLQLFRQYTRIYDERDYTGSGERV